MSRPKRANGAGSVYIKHGSYYGRWTTEAGGHPNRRLGPVRLPGTATGMTRKQAERRLREQMDEVQVATDVERTVAIAGHALLEQLEAKGRAKSHVQTVESHLRVHVAPFFKDKPIDRITEADVTRLLVALRRKGLKPKTARNVLSTVHSLFELALRRRWSRCAARVRVRARDRRPVHVRPPGRGRCAGLSTGCPVAWPRRPAVDEATTRPVAPGRRAGGRCHVPWGS